MPTAKVIPAVRKTAKTAAAGPKSLPQKYFVAPDIFAEEQKKIFAKQWLLVGHQSQLENPGDYIVQKVVGESLILVRNKSGKIHGFFNVCRHRGTRLIEHPTSGADPAGQASNGQCAAIQCPYHAWTYGLDGRLIGAPHMDDVPGFDRADYSLRPVDLGIWNGFIFVNLQDAKGTRRQSDAATGRDGNSLEEWFAPLGEKFSHWNIPMLRSAKRIHYDVKANWKLMFENYSECYHCPGVHPQLQEVSPYDSAENDLTEGPFLGGYMSINKGKSLTMSGNACAAFVGDIKNLQQVFYYSIFPNMLLSLHPEYVMVHQLWPQSPERTLIVCDWFFHPNAFDGGDKTKTGVSDPGYRFNPEDAIEFWDITNKQDWRMCELSQDGIASRAYEPGPYSARESIPAAWDEYYLLVLGENAQR